MSHIRHLFTWRAGADTTLLVALVPLAVAGLLALELAGEGLGALHLLLLGAAPALLHLHLEAGGAAAPVAPLGAGRGGEIRTLHNLQALLRTKHKKHHLMLFSSIRPVGVEEG